MVKHGCVKMDLDESKYPSPVSVIGFYIAAASLVCFLAMLFDILSGFRYRKRWLPCRLFSLNSLTLTLLSIAAKIPVDLTTPMPSAWDQISKLSGSTFICISMGFLMPSLGTNQISECLTNMAALSLFVVIVIVNICIQISTGVIFMFIVEHIMIMCCMLVLLAVLWISALFINRHKDLDLDFNKDLLTKCRGSLFRRLKFVYLYGYCYNPQYVLCSHHLRDLVGYLCVLCSVVIIQAAVRFLSLEFCQGFSDYRWSIWIIVVFQILTIILGSFVSIFRRFMMHFSNEKSGHRQGMPSATGLIMSSPFLRNSLRDRCDILMEAFMLLVTFLPRVIFFPLDKLLVVLISLCHRKRYKYNDNRSEARVVKFVKRIRKEVELRLCLLLGVRTVLSGDIKEYEHLSYEIGVRFGLWSLLESVKDMRRWWMGVSGKESLNYLPKIIEKTLDRVHPDQIGREGSCLSMVLLVRIAQVSIPSELSGSLVQAYSEAHSIIHYIDRRMNSGTYKNRQISKLAQAVWASDDFSTLLPETLRRSTVGGTSGYQTNMHRAVEIIEYLRTAFSYDAVGNEFRLLTTLLTYRSYSSIDDLYDYIEQLFVEMLHIFLAKLPHAIFKEISESPVEELDQRARLALQLLCQVESFKDHIHWSFPVQSDISTLIVTSQMPSDALEEENLDVHQDNVPANRGDQSVPSTNDNVIVEVDDE